MDVGLEPCLVVPALSLAEHLQTALPPRNGLERNFGLQRSFSIAVPFSTTDREP